MVLVIVRGSWIGFHKGLLVEVFKNIGLMLAVFIGLHFYVTCGDALIDVLWIFKPVAHIFSYVFLIGITIGVFRIIRDGLVIMLRDKNDEESFASRVIGMICGFWRALLLSSLVFLGCLTANNIFLTRTVRHSFTAPCILSLSAKLYSGMYRFIVKPVFPTEKENFRVSALIRLNRRDLD